MLKHSELYVKMIHYTDAHSTRVELFPFTLLFDTWLAAQPKPETKPADEKTSGVMNEKH